MSTALFTDLSSYFNNMDPQDPIYQKDLIRPAEIKEDVKLMEQRKRVTNIMRSKLFKKDLENIFLKYKFDDDDVGESYSNLSLADISEQLLLTAIPKNKIANLNLLSSKKGIICINDLTNNQYCAYGKVERQGRCKLASVFRLIDMYGWTSNFNVVMTARPSSEKEQFLINPFGLLFHEVTASSLISVDFRGNILDFGSTILEASPMAWLIHSAVYSSRSSIRAILELKTSAALAISSLEHGLLPLSRESIILGPVTILNNFPVFPNESRSSSLILAGLKNYLTGVIAPNLKVLIIPNCGILICGESIEEAWHLFMNCQIACETQLKLGNVSLDDLYIPDANAQADLYNQWRTTDLGGIIQIKENSSKSPISEHPGQSQLRLGDLEFEALMRHLDNNGYRTGYFYRQENISNTEHLTKTSPTKKTFEVEIPPASTSTIKQARHSLETEDENKTNKLFNRSKSDKWFNTPNKYKIIDDNDDRDDNVAYNFSSANYDKKSTRWASVNVPNNSGPIPQHPITAGAYVAINVRPEKAKVAAMERAMSSVDPKELLENQKRVKNKYYYDTNTAGPISCLLDSGLSREEARMIKNESLKRYMSPTFSSPDDVVVTAGSKGIIQRGHKALVYQDLFKTSNPFDMTADELENYHKEVDMKLNPDKYQFVEIKTEASLQEVTPEIKITVSQNESTLHPIAENDAGEISVNVRDTEIAKAIQPAPKVKESKIRNENVSECHPFFKSDFDEDIDNLNIVDCVFTSISKPPEVIVDVEVPMSDQSSILKKSDSDNMKIDINEDLAKSATLKDTKKKSFRHSFSFKRLGRSKSAKECTEVLENKSATLAAPGYGTITSETSGLEISNDELDKDSKSKKKKRKFKLPSFSKKKKDKSKQS